MLQGQITRLIFAFCYFIGWWTVGRNDKGVKCQMTYIASHKRWWLYWTLAICDHYLSHHTDWAVSPNGSYCDTLDQSVSAWEGSLQSDNQGNCLESLMMLVSQWCLVILLVSQWWVMVLLVSQWCVDDVPGVNSLGDDNCDEWNWTLFSRNFRLLLLKLGPWQSSKLFDAFAINITSPTTCAEVMVDLWPFPCAIVCGCWFPAKVFNSVQ